LTQYGFLLDHRKCIGCHACTVACKAENDVPVGSFRTWVKYQENGTFPTVKRNFAVLRCNHCTNAPCVTICPVTALSKEKNGVVDIDRDVCIGCRACMQACPYDAIYLNEDLGAVEKCHFCNHRLEQNREPACVIVCPEQAIVSGDLHDPNSKISQMTKELRSEVRRPEQNTGPNVHYVGHEPSILEPGAAERPPLYLWSDRPNDKPEAWPESVPTLANTRTVLDTGHKVEWGFGVALYLVTKGIAGGAAMLAPFAVGFGLRSTAAGWAPEVLALVFTTLTTILLIEDLKRPWKFFTLLTRPNLKSWLVKGAYVLITFSGLTSAILAARFFDLPQYVDTLRFPNLIFGALAAAYTAFLFKQCEGRDLWQSSLVLPHLLSQAVLGGAFALLPFSEGNDALARVAIVATLVHIFLSLLEQLRKHSTENSKQAAGFLTRVRCAGVPAFQVGLALSFLSIPLALAVPAIAWLPALAGLLLFEVAFVRAGQLPPLS
jgi:Fe-S-cluster-containing dehydrogenase component/formate-dependent nitrite reductase membrane component NrfD